MVLKLRLARIRTPGGAHRHNPIYNIVLAHARTARDSKPLEVLGTYDPIPKIPVGSEEGGKKVKDIKVDVKRAQYWLGVGAQPSDTVWRLLSMIGLLEPKYLPTAGQSQLSHQTHALKSVRFPTHEEQRDRFRGEAKGPIMQALEGQKRDGGRIGAGTTSPWDANEA